jgi:hypothetical protein
MPDLLKKAAALAALVFALIWLLSVAGTGFSAPDWIGPAGLFCAAVAVVLMVFF